jgi:hypothetical protein
MLHLGWVVHFFNRCLQKIYFFTIATSALYLEPGKKGIWIPSPVLTRTTVKKGQRFSRHVTNQALSGRDPGWGREKNR